MCVVEGQCHIAHVVELLQGTDALHLLCGFQCAFNLSVRMELEGSVPANTYEAGNLLDAFIVGDDGGQLPVLVVHEDAVLAADDVVVGGVLINHLLAQCHIAEADILAEIVAEVVGRVFEHSGYGSLGGLNLNLGEAYL